MERAVVVGKSAKIMDRDLPIFNIQGMALQEDHSLKAVEKAHIMSVLLDNDWNIAKSSKILRIDRTTLYNKIKRYNLRKAD